MNQDELEMVKQKTAGVNVDILGLSELKWKGMGEFNSHDHAAAAAKLLQSCLTLCNPIEGSPPTPPSLGFSRQEHWSGLQLPSPVHESEK